MEDLLGKRTMTAVASCREECDLCPPKSIRKKLKIEGRDGHFLVGRRREDYTAPRTFEIFMNALRANPDM